MNNQDETIDSTDSDTISSEETDINNGNILDVSYVELTKKETFYYKIIDKYYKSINLDKINYMINIINCKSKISLRLLDWFVTKYSNRNKTRIEKVYDTDDSDIDIDDKIDKYFNVHISYKAQLKSYKKRHFDPFRRKKKFKYYFDKNKTVSLCTTIGQLNFFKWAFTNGVIDFIDKNYTEIHKAMVIAKKAEKAKKTETKKRIKQEKLVVKKSGTSITQKTKIDDSKLILSFN